MGGGGEIGDGERERTAFVTMGNAVDEGERVAPRKFSTAAGGPKYNKGGGANGEDVRGARKVFRRVVKGDRRTRLL